MIGRGVRFYLGTDRVPWLGSAGVPLFISARVLGRQKSWPRASVPWALDSGGFTELSTFGRWETTPAAYVAAVIQYIREIGRPDWCAPQDWMCEPWIVAKTGLSVLEHQRRTVDNLLELRSLSESSMFVPVLQGWTLGDYLRHLDMYVDAGVDLAAEPTVGLGSVCRRQGTDEIGQIIARLAGEGLRLHGFGVKQAGIRRYGWMLESADSMAWSYRGRFVRPCPHTAGRSSCAHCLPHALEWRARALAAPPADDGFQLSLV